MKPGLADMKNAIVVPHIASASKVIVLDSLLTKCLKHTDTTAYQPASFFRLNKSDNSPRDICSGLVKEWQHLLL